MNAPKNLPPQLYERWQAISPILLEMGTLSQTDAEALARYLLLEWEYQATVPQVVAAIQSGDITLTEKWTAVQDKLHRQINDLAKQFGLTAESRKKNGWILPWQE